MPTDALAASIARLVPGLALGSPAHHEGNRFSVEGLAIRRGADGRIEVTVRKLEAVALRLETGPLALDAERLTLEQVAAEVRLDGGRPRLCSLQAASVALSGVKAQGPVDWRAQAAAGQSASTSQAHRPTIHTSNAWCLGPLAAADGAIRAKIVDAHLLFDADVTVPIRAGQVDFNDATVEHVGPDSRMGVSRLGIYVDAPNGRSYLYQFPSTPVDGVEFEQRGALLGPWVSARGKLRLQPFGEGVLRRGPAAHGASLTEQARLLLDRTAVSGEVQLGDGMLVVPGTQAEMAGRAEGRNAVRVHSEAVGRGLTVEVASLSIRHAGMDVGSMRLECDAVAGAFGVRLFVEREQLRFALDAGEMKLTGVGLRSVPSQPLFGDPPTRSVGSSP